MSDMKPRAKRVVLGRNEYGMRFSLNAIADIEEHFEVPISEIKTKLSGGVGSVKNVRWLLTLLINEGIAYENDYREEKAAPVAEDYIGRQIDVANISEAIQAIYGLFSDSMPESEETDDPNPESE